MGQGNFS
ncbi:hypothetical protein CFP56_002612 [Quercus suber]